MCQTAGTPLEDPVHEPDHPDAAAHGVEHVTVSGRREVLGVEQLAGLVPAERGPEEDGDFGHRAARRASRRAPGSTPSARSAQPSRPGTTIRTTGDVALRPGEVEEDRPRDADRAQPVELVDDVLVDRCRRYVRHVRKRPRRPLLEARDVVREPLGIACTAVELGVAGRPGCR